MIVPDELELNWDKALNYGISWTRDYFKTAKVNRAVIGVSGGSDSALTAFITMKALGEKNVSGLIMPFIGVTPLDDINDAEELIKALKINRIYSEINPVADAFGGLDPALKKPENKIALANLQARIRMAMLYKEANMHGALVVGTDDKSENILGYFTKYGDGGVDMNVPEYLYKTQVRRLLEHISVKANLNVARKIATKEPSPNLWINHTAEEELGMKYERLDLILFYLFDSKIKMSPGEIARNFNVSGDSVSKLLKMMENNKHKLSLPPSPPKADLR
jgi:NAD+ synthase